jgi:hypothetical protein
MKYRIDSKYVWFDGGSAIALVYFIQGIPFTFDELPKECSEDLEFIRLADKEKDYDLEDVYSGSYYLIMEECHPLLFEVDLENPECLPTD